MLGYQILEKISKYSEIVYQNIGGIFSIDQLPTEIPYNTFLICNQSISDHPGNHWLVRIMKIISTYIITIFYLSIFKALSNQGEGNIEVFDSLGLRENKKLYQRHMKFDGITINDFPVQKQDTSSCGNFVIYYICSRFFNGT